MEENGKRITFQLVPLAVVILGLITIGLLDAFIYFSNSANLSKPFKSALASTGSLVVTGVQADNSSVKIDFNPVQGAADYRAFDVANPSVVKYAGLVHVSGNTDVPATEIEWNLLGDNKPHTLVVEALDSIGPVPPGNLYNSSNAALFPQLALGGMLGSNSGQTQDGNRSINGQGPYTNTPNVIAASTPFVVQANPTFQAIPSTKNATQTFFDTFPDSEAPSIKEIGSPDPNAGTAHYTINSGKSNAWDIFYQQADTTNSMPFIMDDHFMDVLFDGGTPGSNDPLHVLVSSMGMSPSPTLDFSNGQIVHLTMEVDSHVDNIGRWMRFALAPVNDPNIKLEEDAFVPFRPNASNNALYIGIFDGTCSGDVYYPSGGMFSFWGAAGSHLYCPRTSGIGGDGRGFDNRSRFDLFVSQTHAALFEDGKMVIQSDIPGGLGFTQAKAYFIHTEYPKDEQFDLPKYQPYETYWINEFKFSDERHWDNMGMEVLPASQPASPTDWSSLASLVQMPPFQAPGTSNITFTPIQTVTVTPTTVPSPTSNPKPTATSTPTPTTIKPTSTPVPTVAPVVYTPLPTPTEAPIPTPTIQNTPQTKLAYVKAQGDLFVNERISAIATTENDLKNSSVAKSSEVQTALNLLTSDTASLNSFKSQIDEFNNNTQIDSQLVPILKSIVTKYIYEIDIPKAYALMHLAYLKVADASLSNVSEVITKATIFAKLKNYDTTFIQKDNDAVSGDVSTIGTDISNISGLLNGNVDVSAMQQIQNAITQSHGDIKKMQGDVQAYITNFNTLVNG